MKRNVQDGFLNTIIFVEANIIYRSVLLLRKVEISYPHSYVFAKANISLRRESW